MGKGREGGGAAAVGPRRALGRPRVLSTHLTRAPYTRPLCPLHNARTHFCSVLEAGGGRISLAPDAVEALRCAAEAHLVGLFEGAERAASHADRRHVEVKDLQLALKLSKARC